MWLVNSRNSLLATYPINKFIPSMNYVWILRWGWYRHCISGSYFPEECTITKWVIGLCFSLSWDRYKSLKYWASWSRFLFQWKHPWAVFSKLLPNTVKINAFPSPLIMTCYAASADKKVKTGGSTPNLAWFVPGQSVCQIKDLKTGILDYFQIQTHPYCINTWGCVCV